MTSLLNISSINHIRFNLLHYKEALVNANKFIFQTPQPYFCSMGSG